MKTKFTFAFVGQEKVLRASVDGVKVKWCGSWSRLMKQTHRMPTKSQHSIRFMYDFNDCHCVGPLVWFFPMLSSRYSAEICDSWKRVSFDLVLALQFPSSILFEYLHYRKLINSLILLLWFTFNRKIGHRIPCGTLYSLLGSPVNHKFEFIIAFGWRAT